MVVATFVLVVLLLKWLFPQGAGWTGVCVAVTCLYAGTFVVWALFGSQTGKKGKVIEGATTQAHPLRDNLLYFSVAMVAVTLVIAVTVHDTERGIHRSFKNDWFVGFGSACFALGYAVKAFWALRRNWRLWAVIVALFILFTATTLPILSQMKKAPLLLMGPLANVELLLAIFLLDWIVPRKSAWR